MQVLCTDKVSRGLQIKELSQIYNISRREGDVLKLLTQGVTTIASMSAALGLSPNTVSNHLKSLLAKTDTGNKAELLSIVLNRTLARLVTTEVYCRRPSALLIEAAPNSLGDAAQALKDQGFTVDRRERGEVRGPLSVDLLVIDDEFDGRTVLAPLIEAAGRADLVPPALVLSRQFTEDTPLPIGKGEILQLPCEAKRLAFMAVYLSTTDEARRGRMQRVDGALEATIGGARYAVGNVGFGGAFVAVPKELLLKERSFRIGRQVEFSLGLNEGQTITGTAQVCWIRKKEESRQPAGLGLRFVNLNAPGLRTLKCFIQSHRTVPAYPT